MSDKVPLAQPVHGEAGTPVSPASVILCSRNRPDMLRDAVASILAGEDLPAELIIVDQSDAADSALEQIAASAAVPVRYVRTDAVGLSRASNTAADLAISDVLVFTHDDVRVDPAWLRTLVTALTPRGRRAVVTGRVLPATERADGFAPALTVDLSPAEYEGLSGLGKLRPLNMGLYRETLREAGGFDPRLGPGTSFPGAEDADLTYRLLRADCRLIYVPEAVVYHRAWRPERDYLPLRWGYGIAQGAFYAKHLRRDTALLGHIVRDVARRARRFPRRLVREPRRALADPLFLLGNLVGAGRWFVTSERTPRRPSGLS